MLTFTYFLFFFFFKGWDNAIYRIVPFTFMEKTQLALNPAESVTWYLMYVWPTFSTCGGYKPRRFNELLELSVGTGTCHVTVAFAFPTSVVTSMVGGHWMYGGWISVQGISDICINQFKKCRYDWFFLALFESKQKENQTHIFFCSCQSFSSYTTNY